MIIRVLQDQDYDLFRCKAIGNQSEIKRQGYRITPQRLAILKILAASAGHPSVEQIYNRVKQDFPTTSLATVYKTVVLLKNEGEILELGFANGSRRYDGNKPYPHPHLICLECQNIFDPEVTMLQNLYYTILRANLIGLEGEGLKEITEVARIEDRNHFEALVPRL